MGQITLPPSLHEHSLNLIPVEGNIDRQSAKCRACDGPFLAKSAFACVQCNYFLHYLCAKMEHTIDHHVFHANHRLRLLPPPSLKERIASFITRRTCDCCGGRITGFHYYCETCNFTMHHFCAYLPQICSPDHQGHDLKPELDRSFTCNACNRKGKKYLCYACSQCRYYLHPKCLVRDIKPQECVGRVPRQSNASIEIVVQVAILCFRTFANIVLPGSDQILSMFLQARETIKLIFIDQARALPSSSRNNESTLALKIVWSSLPGSKKYYQNSSSSKVIVEPVYLYVTHMKS